MILMNEIIDCGIYIVHNNIYITMLRIIMTNRIREVGYKINLMIEI